MNKMFSGPGTKKTKTKRKVTEIGKYCQIGKLERVYNFAKLLKAS